jgi:hypothetical protein
MKYRISILAVALATILVALLPMQSQAQIPTYGSPTLFSTNGYGGTPVPAAVATTLNAVVDCRKQASFTLQITAYGDTGVGAGNLVMVGSVDGATYSASTGAGAAVKTVGFTPTVTGLTVVTNINSYGCGYWKALYYTNDTGAALTNLSIKYGVKISAP